MNIDLINRYVKILKRNEKTFYRRKKDPEDSLNRTIYINRTGFFNFTIDEMKEIASNFNSKFYVLPDDINKIDFNFKK
ncbi:hypothetical protein ACETAC_07380 [Aceticella autotrophica]|uniref:Uncharacterized protein n=1 Tax=Aceticella autotrophica TaxID=2755338 RepID=A0A975AUI6_9THEO|nr:hypothetical protein [Aceticella autotrophica]QSZ26716.1 hypothetical protein ACETAC_07380 [Aceticella autotrophica]